MGKIKKTWLRAVYRYIPQFFSSDMMISYLQECDCTVGEHTIFYNAGTITVDVSRPALLEIGDYCKITAGVKILTHDYSRSVLRRVYGDVVGEAKKTIIGDNVFIGLDSVILMGTVIGKNTIIGAGSVCSGSYPDNSVIAGNPAKVILTLEEYYQKRKNKTIEEAKEYVRLFCKKYARKPSIEEMGAFFPLYLKRDRQELIRNHIRTRLGGDSEEEVINCFLKSESPYFSSYDKFLDEALKNE